MKGNLLVVPVEQTRGHVKTFAGLMEAKLRQNDHKGGWEREPVHFLLQALIREVAELVESIGFDNAFGHDLHDEKMLAAYHLRLAAAQFGPFGAYLRHKPSPNAPGEAADVANFCMMLTEQVQRREVKV